MLTVAVLLTTVHATVAAAEPTQPDARCVEPSRGARATSQVPAPPSTPPEMLAGSPQATDQDATPPMAPPPMPPPETPQPEMPPPETPPLETPPPSAPFPPPPSFASSPGAPTRDEWPIEYVLRPQTIPEGWVLAAVSSALVLPDPSYRLVSGSTYHRYLRLGASATFGLTNRLEVSASMPRVLCENTGAPSGCSDYARFDGTGVGLALGVLRTHAFQVRVSSGISVALTDPMIFVVGANVRAKWLIANVVALELELDVSKWLDAPAFYQFEATAFGSADAELDLQLSRHLLLYLDAEPAAPLDALGESRLEVAGGLSWTFENATEVGASAGDFNVLARRPGDTSIPEKFVAAFWRLFL